MKNTFLKLFKGHQKAVPEPVKNKLINHFPNALNVDWETKKNGYEAVFYVDEVEHIAQLSDDGELLEFKKNLWPNELPAEITEKCRSYGEIMNSILITRKETTLYEVIIRDASFKRRLLLFDASGNLIDSGKL